MMAVSTQKAYAMDNSIKIRSPLGRSEYDISNFLYHKKKMDEFALK